MAPQDDFLVRSLMSLEVRVGKLEDTTERLVRLEEKTATLTTDTQECLAGIQSLNHKIDEQDEHRRSEVELRRQERKADFRWLLASVFTAAGLVIAAIGLLPQ